MASASGAAVTREPRTPGRRAHVRWLPLTAIVWALTAIVLATVVSSAAGARGSARASGPIVLRPGDAVTVTGTKLRCAVSTAPGATHPTTLICGEGDLQSPLPGTYALAFADGAALVIRSSARRQPELVARKLQPPEHRPPAPVPRRAATTVDVSPGAILLVGGGDVLCGVSSQAGAATLTCGLGAGGSGTFVIGSYVGVLSQRFALLDRLLSKSTFSTIVSRRQPSG